MAAVEYKGKFHAAEVKLNTATAELDVSRAETARAMELGTELSRQAHATVATIAAERDAAATAATTATATAAEAAAAATTISQQMQQQAVEVNAAHSAANAAEHAAATATTGEASASLRAPAAEHALDELRAAVEREKPNVMAQRAELARLQAQVPELESQLAALSSASEEDKKDNIRLQHDLRAAAQDAKHWRQQYDVQQQHAADMQLRYTTSTEEIKM